MGETRKLLGADLLNPHSGLFYNYVTQADFAFGPHTHDFYELFLVVHGHAIHRVNGCSERIQEGTLVLVRPADSHAYEVDGMAACGFINLAFRADSFADLLAYLGDTELADWLGASPHPPSTLLSKADAGWFLDKLRHFEPPTPGRQQSDRVLFRLLLAEAVRLLMQEREALPSMGGPAWLSRLMVEMRDTVHFVEGIPAMLKISGKSPAYLCRVFKHELGISPTQFLNGLRLTYAAKLLVNGDVDILGVCMEAGFGNASHFHHLFRARYGTTPLQYRRLHKRPAPL